MHPISPPQDMHTMKLLRRLEKRFARRHGYFWLPCPLCGEEFGGHEWLKDTDEIPACIRIIDQPGSGMGICPTCTLERKGHKLWWIPESALVPKRQAGKDHKFWLSPEAITEMTGIERIMLGENQNQSRKGTQK